MPDKITNPTILDLQLEQLRQSIVLEDVKNNLVEIKECLMGTGGRAGLVMDLDRVKRAVSLGDDGESGLLIQMDRLKRSMSLLQAALWVIFTTGTGTIITFAVKKMFLEQH